MRLANLIDRLLAIQNSGNYDDYDVCYYYEEDGLPVRDTVTQVTIAESYDGEEIHLWQD